MARIPYLEMLFYLDSYRGCLWPPRHSTHSRKKPGQNLVCEAPRVPLRPSPAIFFLKRSSARADRR